MKLPKIVDIAQILSAIQTGKEVYYLTLNKAKIQLKYADYEPDIRAFFFITGNNDELTVSYNQFDRERFLII